MSYLSKNIISKFTGLAVVIILLPVIFYFVFEKNKKVEVDSHNSFYKELPEFMALLNRRWIHGDIENLWGTKSFLCSDIPKRLDTSNPSFLRCNYTYLKCVFTQGLDSVGATIKTKHHEFRAKPNSFVVTKKDNLKIDFIELKTNKEFSIKLENHCHNTYLPEKIYSTGRDPYSENIWDNYNQNIFLDKYYAGESDLSRGKILNYTIEQQKEYCLKQGKTLMQSHIFNASSFFPSKYEEGFLFKSKYPWSKSGRLSLKKEKPYANTISWIGINHVLGDELEVFENLFDSKANLKVSNRLLRKNSYWHQLGLRANWSGEGFLQKSFNFTDNFSQEVHKINLKTKGVAFRCMSQK